MFRADTCKKDKKTVKIRIVYPYVYCGFKGAFRDSSILFLWYDSIDIHEKGLFPKFQLIQTFNL